MIGQENLIAVALSRSLCPRTIIINGRRADPINLLSHTQKFKLAYISCFSLPEVEKVLFTSHCKAQRYGDTKIQNLVFCQRSSLFCMLIVFLFQHHLKPIHHHRLVDQRLKRPPKIIFKSTLHSLGCFWLGFLFCLLP